MKVWYPGAEDTIHATAGLLKPGENEVGDEVGRAMVESGFCQASAPAPAATNEAAPVTSTERAHGGRRRGAQSDGGEE